MSSSPQKFNLDAAINEILAIRPWLDDWKLYYEIRTMKGARRVTQKRVARRRKELALQPTLRFAKEVQPRLSLHYSDPDLRNEK